MLFRNDDGGIKLSSDELSSDEDDDSLINENRQLFRPGPNGMSDDDLSEGILTKNPDLSSNDSLDLFMLVTHYFRRK